MRAVKFAPLLIAVAVVLGVQDRVGAQQLRNESSPLFARAFADVVASELTPLTSIDTPAAVAPSPPSDQTTDDHPPPAHTGLSALVHTTWDDFKAFPQRRSTWVILGIGAGASLLAHPVDKDLNAHLVGSTAAERLWRPGHIIGAAYTQVAVSVGLYAIGRYVIPPDTDQPATAGASPRTNKWSHMGFDLLRAQIVSQALIQPVKFAVRRDRPNGDKYGFPSGHAATAFAVASVVERHFGYRLSVPTIAAATYVATSRLHDNVHYLSDVLFGAAIGTATGWTVVGRHGRSSYALAPVPIPGGFAVQLTHASRGGESTN